MSPKSVLSSQSIPREVLRRRQQCSWLQLDSLSQELSLPFLRGEDARPDQLGESSSLVSCPLCEEVMHTSFLGAHVCEQHVKRNQEYITVGHKAFLNCKCFPCVFKERRRSRHWHCICGKSLARFNTAQKHAAVCEIAMRTPPESVLTLQGFIDLAKKFTADSARDRVVATPSATATPTHESSSPSAQSLNTTPSPGPGSERSLDLSIVSSSSLLGLGPLTLPVEWPATATETSCASQGHSHSAPMSAPRTVNVNSLTDPMRFLDFCSDVLDPMLGSAMLDPSMLVTPPSEFIHPQAVNLEKVHVSGGDLPANNLTATPFSDNRSSTGVLTQSGSPVDSDLVLPASSTGLHIHSTLPTTSSTPRSIKRTLPQDGQLEEGPERQRPRTASSIASESSSTDDTTDCQLPSSYSLTALSNDTILSRGVASSTGFSLPCTTRPSSPCVSGDQSVGIAKVTIVSAFPTSTVSVPFFRDWPLELVVNSVQLHIKRHLAAVIATTPESQLPANVISDGMSGFMFHAAMQHQLWLFSNPSIAQGKPLVSPKLLAPEGDVNILHQPAGDWIIHGHSLVAVCFS